MQNSRTPLILACLNPLGVVLGARVRGSLRKAGADSR